MELTSQQYQVPFGTGQLVLVLISNLVWPFQFGNWYSSFRIQRQLRDRYGHMLKKSILSVYKPVFLTT